MLEHKGGNEACLYFLILFAFLELMNRLRIPDSIFGSHSHDKANAWSKNELTIK